MINPFNWFSGKRIDTFARDLARDLAQRYPLEMCDGPADKKREKKLGRTLNHVYRQAREFRRDRGLGIYGTARLGNTFKWELREMGYHDDFIEETTKGLLLSVREK